MILKLFYSDNKIMYYKLNIVLFGFFILLLNSFDSCKEAGEYIGISLNSINLCCIGKAKTAKGYVWKYEPIIK